MFEKENFNHMEKDNIICEIQECDLKKLQQILKDVFNNNITYESMQNLYKQCKNNKDTHILGYYIKDKLVGTLILKILLLPSGKEATIWDLAVKEEYRNLGIGTKLMNKAEEITRKYKDITRIWLFSGVYRKNAHKLYRKLGYNEYRDKAFIKELKKET